MTTQVHPVPRTPAVKAVLKTDDGWLRDRKEPGRDRKMRFQSLLARALARQFKDQQRKVRDLVGRIQPVPAKAAPPWWADQIDEILAEWELAPDVTRVFGAATVDGVALFGEGLGLGVDFGLTNTEAALWARKYVGTLIKGISKTSAESVRKAVAYFVTTPGATLGDAMQLMPFDVRRARRIATTEITRAYSEGNQMGASALADQFPMLRVVKRWWTNNDSRVCPICAPLHGAEATWDALFVEPSAKVPDGISRPPGHVGCRCWTSYRTVAR